MITYAILSFIFMLWLAFLNTPNEEEDTFIECEEKFL
jgi:hypothetical protein